MTTRQLAEKLDIVPATVTVYENGKQPIPYDVAVKLADILEIEASCVLSTRIPKNQKENSLFSEAEFPSFGRTLLAV